MKKTKASFDLYRLALLGFIGLGIVLRLIQFGSIPPDLNRDEAALGYNAYSLAHYGVDEWNQPFPILFKSFGDYKLPGYIYMLAPLVRMFGVYDWVVRLPSLLAGIGLIYLAYAMAFTLTKNQLSSLMAGAITALQPWSVFYSRTAFEAHLALLWLVLTLILLLKPYRWYRHVILAVTYLLAILTYNTPWLLLPILLMFIWFAPGKKLRQRLFLIMTMLGIGIVGWLVLAPVTDQKQHITIFSDPTIRESINQNYSQAQGWLGRLVSTQYATWVLIMLKNFVKSFGPLFLVIRGGSHPWHGISGYGHLFWIVYLMGIGSLYALFKKTSNRLMLILFFALMLGSLLPSVVTVDAPHATRSLLFLYLFGVLASLAWNYGRRWRLAAIGVLLVESFLYAKAYFFSAPYILPRPYPGGIQEAVETAFLLAQPNQSIVVTNKEGVNGDVLSDQLYIWVLLYGKVDPRAYEQTRQLVGVDAAGMVRIGRVNQVIMVNDRGQIPPESLIIERDGNGVYRLIPQV